MTIKKWSFRGQMLVIGVEKIASRKQNRKAKWCKMQVLGLKIDKPQGLKD